MNQFKNHIVAVVTLAGLVFTSACQNDSGAEPLPSATNSSTTAAATPRPNPTRAPAWESRYTARQLRTYEAALRRFQEYEKKSEPIWRAGKANAQTQRFFKKYFLGWYNQQRLLATYEQVQVRTFGVGRTLSSRPTRIVAAGDDGQSVTIKQCVDFNATRTFQYGKQVKQTTKKPQVRIIVLSRFNRPEAPWMITDLKNSQGKHPCSAA